MATITDTKDLRDSANTAEAIKAAQDAARRYMDESAAIGRTYFAAWDAAAQASMRTAFDLQNAMIQASRSVLDATCQASRSWFDQAAESVRKSQEATIKLVVAGFDVLESTMPKPRP